MFGYCRLPMMVIAVADLHIRHDTLRIVDVTAR